jgi:hypothetical protein
MIGLHCCRLLNDPGLLTSATIEMNRLSPRGRDLEKIYVKWKIQRLAMGATQMLDPFVNNFHWKTVKESINIVNSR